MHNFFYGKLPCFTTPSIDVWELTNEHHNNLIKLDQIHTLGGNRSFSNRGIALALALCSFSGSAFVRKASGRSPAVSPEYFFKSIDSITGGAFSRGNILILVTTLMVRNRMNKTEVFILKFLMRLSYRLRNCASRLIKRE